MLTAEMIESGIFHLLFNCREHGYRSAGEDFWSVTDDHGAVRTTDNAYGGLDVSSIIERYAAEACDAGDDHEFRLWYETVLPEIMQLINNMNTEDEAYVY